jgi:hypothetical protein
MQLWHGLGWLPHRSRCPQSAQLIAMCALRLIGPVGGEHWPQQCGRHASLSHTSTSKRPHQWLLLPLLIMALATSTTCTAAAAAAAAAQAAWAGAGAEAQP